MLTHNGYALYVDTKWHGGLFDVDIDGNISKVLKMFYTDEEGNDKLRFARFPYSNAMFEYYYRPATQADLDKYGCLYFEEDGYRPFKTKCEGCGAAHECFLKDNDMIKYGVEVRKVEDS